MDGSKVQSLHIDRCFLSRSKVGAGLQTCPEIRSRLRIPRVATTTRLIAHAISDRGNPPWLPSPSRRVPAHCLPPPHPPPKENRPDRHEADRGGWRVGGSLAAGGLYGRDRGVVVRIIGDFPDVFRVRHLVVLVDDEDRAGQDARQRAVGDRDAIGVAEAAALEIADHGHVVYVLGFRPASHRERRVHADRAHLDVVAQRGQFFAPALGRQVADGGVQARDHAEDADLSAGGAQIDGRQVGADRAEIWRVATGLDVAATQGDGTAFKGYGCHANAPSSSFRVWFVGGRPAGAPTSSTANVSFRTAAGPTRPRDSAST